VVANGVVYFGSHDGHVYAVDAASGTEKWKFKADGPVDATPAIFKGKVFVGGQRNFYVLDAASGVKVESFDAEGSASSPVVAYGTVLVGGPKWLYAINPETGKQIVRGETGCGDGRNLPAISKGVVYFTWRTSVTGVDVRTLAKVAGNYVSCDGRSISVSDEGMGYLGVHNGTWAYDLNARDEIGGALRTWVTSTGGIYDYRSPNNGALVGKTFYITHSDGNLHAMNVDNGKILWTYKTGAKNMAGVSHAGGLVYTGACDGSVCAVDAASGKEKWKFKAGGAVVSTPWIQGDTLYVGCDDGFLYALH